jgi:hypothetical protein
MSIRTELASKPRPASQSTFIAVAGILGVIILVVLMRLMFGPGSEFTTIEQQWLVGP